MAGGSLQGVVHWLARLLIPTRCVLCQRLGPEALCESCALLLEPVGRCCNRCGRRRYTSFESPDCGECHGRRLGIEAARSSLIYNEAGRKLLAEFKFRGRQAAGQVLAVQILSRLGDGLQSLYRQPELQAAALVPVPMHPQRLRQRRFNQAEFLAQRLGRHFALPVWTEVLQRSRDTETQVGKSAAQRKVNVRGAFSVPDRARERIAGRSLILVDDVMTTGATLHACALALGRGGADRTYGLTAFSTQHGFEPEMELPAPRPAGL